MLTYFILLHFSQFKKLPSVKIEPLEAASHSSLTKMVQDQNTLAENREEEQKQKHENMFKSNASDASNYHLYFVFVFFFLIFWTIFKIMNANFDSKSEDMALKQTHSYDFIAMFIHFFMINRIYYSSFQTRCRRSCVVASKQYP